MSSTGTGPDGARDGKPEETRWGRRLLWFVGLWAAGVGVVGLGAYLLRFVAAP